jgi:hypothetical protein
LKRAAGAALALALTVAAAPARAQNDPPGREGIDDPKIERRLGARVPGAAAAPTADQTVTRVSAPEDARSETSGLSVPHVKLGFRRFDFVRIGATDPGSTNGAAASEPFNSVSLDFYPVSTVLRFGLTTQYGWQSGTFRSNGDYFIAQSFSLGVQLPRRAVTPFAEAFGGGGYMRRVQFDRSIPTVYWQLGVDVGAEVYLSRLAYLSFALGYLHPVNGFASAESTGTSVDSASFKSVFVDTWSLKLGVGL